MSLHCVTLFYSYTQTYIDNISQFIYLQNLAVLPFLNVKPLVYSNTSCKNTFCRWDYRLNGSYSYIYFCRISIHAFHAGDLKGSNNYRTAFTNLIQPYPLIKVTFFQNKQSLKDIYRESNYKLLYYMRAVANTITVIKLKLDFDLLNHLLHKDLTAPLFSHISVQPIKETAYASASIVIMRDGRPPDFNLCKRFRYILQERSEGADQKI